MRPQIVTTLIQFILAEASKNEWPDCELGDIHIIKYLYLADLSHAYRSNGETLTGIQWKFYHFGPYSTEAYMSIEPALLAIGANKKKITTEYSEDFHRWSVKNCFQKMQQHDCIDEISLIEIQGLVKKFGADTASLLHYTYTTEPMLSASPNDILHFPKEKRKHIAHTRSAEVKKTTKQIKKEKEKVTAIKAVFKEKLRKKIDELNKKKSACFKIPRYDEVFFAGVDALEELAGDKIDKCDLVCEFSESFWKSKARHDPELP